MTVLIIFILTDKGGGHNFGIVTWFTLKAYDRARRVSFRAVLVDSH